MRKLNELILNVCTLVEMSGIIGLTAIALKRNYDCAKAEARLVETEEELIIEQTRNMIKDLRIYELTKEVAALKTKYENTEGES